MILPSIYLFLLTVTGTGDYREHYIGRVRDCDVADEIMSETRTVMKKEVLGYICLNFNSNTVRKGFKNSRIIQEFDIELVAQYTLKPLFKKKKLQKRSKDGNINNRVSN
tara:strand:- start:514 stop:840 length:327 start_codon:yes stop_codon:yes gene_type:complete